MSKKHPRLARKKGLYLKDAGAEKGRGLFCDEDIARGAVLEVTPALLLNEQHTRHTDKTRLREYVFTVGGISKALRARKKVNKTSDASCVIMGVMTYCNHSETPNAAIEWEEKAGTLYHTLKATRRIPRHTEICTSYGGGWFEDRK